MATSPAKENILKKIRQALSNPVPLPFPNSEGSQSVFHPAADDIAIVFAEEFAKLQGRFAFCQDEKDLIAQLQQLFAAKAWTKFYARESWMLDLLRQMGLESTNDLEGCDVTLTGCEFLVARTGTIAMSSGQASGRTSSVYAPIHICIANSEQLVYDVKDALQGLKEKYAGNIPSFITFASGPSRTADIEKTLVTGVHGPKEVFCFLIDN